MQTASRTPAAAPVQGNGRWAALAAPARARSVALVMLVATAFIAFVRARGYDEPLEPDIVTYATIGHELVNGERLYADVFDVKPPGLYYAYAFAERLVGRGAPSVFFLGLASALLTMAALVVAAWPFGLGAVAFAATSWAWLSGTLSVQANQPNSEVFINAFCSVAVALLLLRTPRFTRARWFAAGLALAWASSFKPVAVFPAAFIAIVHVAVGQRAERGRRLIEASCLAAGGVVFWAIVFGWAALTGQFADYWAANVTANGARSAGLLFNLYRYLREGKVFPLRLLFLLPFVAVVTAAIALGWRTAERRAWAVLAAWALGAHFMIFTQGGAFHPHSYQFWLPVLSLGGAFAVALGLRSPTRAWWPALASAGALVVAVAHELPHLFASSTDWARQKYGDAVVLDRELSRALGDVLAPTDDLFQYGDGAAIYYYTGKRPSTPTLWSSLLFTSSPPFGQVSARTLDALAARPPELFVVIDPQRWAGDGEPETQARGLAARLLSAPPAPQAKWDRHPIFAWASAHYELWTGPPFDALLRSAPNHFAFYVRRGGSFERRWSNPGRRE